MAKQWKIYEKGINVTLINKAEDFLKYTIKPTYIAHKTSGKNYAAIHKIKPVLILNKPIYVGFSVLELSKWLMYEFHYKVIKKNFDAELLFTDTDRLAYEIKSEDIFMVNHYEFLSQKFCLTLVTIHEIQSFLMKQIKKLLEK